MPSPSLRRAGLSLTEVVGALVISSFVLIAALETLAGSMRNIGWTNDGVKAVMLAEQRMTEVLCNPYEDPDGNAEGIGREADESPSPSDRRSFDDIDDFDGTINSPPETSSGTLSPGFTGWTLEFAVDHVEVEPAGDGTFRTSSSETGLKRVHVRVTDPQGKVTDLFALRSRHGPHEAPAAFDMTRTILFKAIVTVDETVYLEQATEILNNGDRP